MAYYPLVLPIRGSYRSWHAENKSRSNPRLAGGQLRDNWGRTQFNAELAYDHRKTQTLVVIGFWKQHRNDEFYFIDFDIDIFFDVLIGTGNGIDSTFVIPAKSISSYTVWLGVTPQVEGADYNISPGTGPGGEDQLIFTSTPASGVQIFMDYTGKGRFLCFFANEPVREVPSDNRIIWRVTISERITEI